MIAYSYKRFSSKHQAQGHSIERQTKLAEDYCKANDLELSGFSFEDLGVSAWSGRNADEDAGLGQFISALSSGKVTTPCYLLVESLDRLSRAKIQKAMRQLMDITDFGVTVITLLDGKQYTNDMEFSDFLMAGVVMQRAFEESETKSKRLKAVWAKKRQAGEMHSNAPFWIDRTEEGYKLNEFTSTVQRIFEMCSQGMGHYTITNILNAEGLKAPNSTWNSSTISKMLRSRSVIGEYQPNTVTNKVATPIGDPIYDYYPAVIDIELFNKAQVEVNQRLAKHKSHRGGSTKTHRNILRDIGTCSCGKYLSLVKKRQRYYLQCMDSRQGLCSARSIQLDAFEKWLRQYFCSPMYHNSWVSADDANLEIDNKISSLKLEMDTNKEALEGLLSVNQNLGNPLILKKIEELSESLTERSMAIQELENSKGTGNKAQSLAETFKLIDLAFGEEDNQPEIAARNQLKQMLNCFDSIQLTRQDTDNGKVLHYDLVVGFKEQPIAYRSIEAPTALQNTKKKEIWFRYTNETINHLTEEQKKVIIHRHKIN
ncbi:recombinase family protein [Vibrio bathopelagicus]